MVRFTDMLTYSGMQMQLTYCLQLGRKSLTHTGPVRAFDKYSCFVLSGNAKIEKW